MLRRAHAILLLYLACCSVPGRAAETAFAQRGYYMTFMRMPTFGLPEWKEMIDCIHADGGNTLLLWTADGLLIESSDYAICYCGDCRGKFFDLEFDFVQQISREVWARNPGATIMVYPHYFSNRPVPGFDVTGATHSFDPRWTLFFTPHSAHIETNLMRAAKASVYSTSGLSLGTPARLRDDARLARRQGITGLLPSLEPFSCIDGPPGSGKARLKPFHFAWLRDGQMPLNELLMRVNRIAYREFARDPDLADDEFRRKLGAEIYAARANPTNTADLL